MYLFPEPVYSVKKITSIRPSRTYQRRVEIKKKKKQRLTTLTTCRVFLLEIRYRREHEDLQLRSEHAVDIYWRRAQVRDHTHESHVGRPPGRSVSRFFRRRRYEIIYTRSIWARRRLYTLAIT